MKAFEYQRAATVEEALQAGASSGARYLGGGTNLIDLLKERVMVADRLVDLTWLEAPRLQEIREENGGLWLGALVKNATTANHPLVRQNYPLLTMAILAGASPQLRNMATNGGNVLQRTRCNYFYEPSLPCNKREPGSGCSALEGHHHNHAILGWTPQCVATFPSDMATGLTALEAVVHIRGADGQARQVPIDQFHRLEEPHVENVLAKGDLIEGFQLPSPTFAARCFYLKVRERASYAFALVAVAAALRLEDGTIRDARLALGSVALKPWRCRAAEQVLTGQSPSEELFRKAAVAALQEARPLRDNAYKVELARRAVARALTRSAGV